MKPAGAAALLVAALAAHPARAIEAAPESGPCSLEQAAPATIARLDDDFELLLDDGKRIVLTGLEFPTEATLRAAALAQLRDRLLNAQVFLRPLAVSPDRWSRTPAQIFAPASRADDAPLVSLGAALLSEGLARFRPDNAAASCAKAYLAAETPARAKRLGVWSADPVVDFDSLAYDSLTALAQRKGMIVVGGTVRSVGETKTTFYLNFGARRGRDFALTISKREAAKFAQTGLTLRALVGRRVLARGLLDAARGLRMEIGSPEQLQMPDDSAAR